MRIEECIKRLRALEEAFQMLQYPATNRCGDVYMFLDSLRQIGQQVVAVREALEKQVEGNGHDESVPDVTLEQLVGQKPAEQ